MGKAKINHRKSKEKPSVGQPFFYGEEAETIENQRKTIGQPWDTKGQP